MDDRRGHNLKQKRTFDQTVDLFDVRLPHEIEGRLGEIVAAARIQPGQVVLDVGAGVGALIPHIQTFKPSRILACDLSPRMLKRLKKKFPQVETFLADVIDIELPDGSLDAAFMNGMFSNIYDKPAALANLCRLLKPGGRMIVSHPEGRGFIVKLQAQVDFHLDPLPDEEEWLKLLEPFPLESVYYLDAPRQFIAVARRTA
ncbi:MAG: class I SAM-dependent methyltransferase [Deltaproteobacteria bacterium]|nr:class I SAM-dependent methyltransferase [Deltaproteobacteria bacterium]